MKLKSISFKQSPRLPGVSAGAFVTLDIEQPSEALRGWRVVLRGPTIYFVSPPGFKAGAPRSQWRADGPVTIFEVPRADTTMHWIADGTADVDALLKGCAKYDAVLGPPPVVTDDRPILAQIPPGQLGDA